MSNKAENRQYKRIVAGLQFDLDGKIKSLSVRELDVAKLVAEGLSNREISEKIFVSEGTVKTHIRNILSKLDRSDRTQIAIDMITSFYEEQIRELKKGMLPHDYFPVSISID